MPKKPSKKAKNARKCTLGTTFLLKNALFLLKMPIFCPKMPIFLKFHTFFKHPEKPQKPTKPQNARKCTQGTTFLQKMLFFQIFQKPRKTQKIAKKRQKTVIFSKKTSKIVIFSEKTQKNAQK